MTEEDVAAEMTELDARIARLAPVLQRGINPDQLSMDGPDGLEIGWRRDPEAQEVYFLVLNPEDAHKDGVSLALHGVHPAAAKVVDEDREVSVREGNSLVDDFAPYELHIYKVAADQ